MSQQGTSSGSAVHEHDQERREQVREGLTMALYVGLSLQAVLLVTPTPDAGESPGAVALRIFLTAIGLLVAHQVALRLSTKLTNAGELDEGTMRSLRAQTLGGVPVAVIASVPVLIWGPAGLIVAELILLAFMAAVGYFAARSRGASRGRSMGYVLTLVLIVAAILSLKIMVKP